MKILGPVSLQLEGVKDPVEYASIKGSEIAKLGTVPRENVKFSDADFDIEIVSMKAIKGGVEIFARAWMPNGDQIGFGKDGSVDIERFRIINPPILVSAGTQSLSNKTDLDGGPIFKEDLKEDPLEAMKHRLAHIIKVKQEKHGPEKIVSGKIGNTTSEFHPQVSPASTACYGYTVNVNGDFATCRNAATGSGADSSAELYFTYEFRSGLSDYRMFRNFTLFDTSSIPDGDTISSATYSICHFTTNAADDNGDSVSIVGATPASNTVIVTADYDQLGSTKFATDIPFSTITGNNTFYNFPLNATGIAAILKTGVTKMGFRTALDIANTQPTGLGQRNFYGSNNASFDPALVVEHSSAVVTTLNLSETPSITERFSRTWTAPRSLSDRPGVTETFTRSWSITRGLAERITITESTLTGRIITAVLSEFVAISESLGRIVAWSRSATETISITERFTRAATYARGLAESIAVTDLLTRAVNYGRILIENISILEYLRTPLNWLKRTKPTTSWTPRTPPSPTSPWTARTPPSSTWKPRIKP